jgi:hypothetical protein
MVVGCWSWMIHRGVTMLEPHAGMSGLGLRRGTIGAIAGVAPFVNLGLEPFPARQPGVIAEVGDPSSSVEVDASDAF